MNPLGLAALGGALWWLSRLSRNPDGAGFRDKNGRFHPIRSSEWYQPSLLDHPEPTLPSASAERPAAPTPAARAEPASLAGSWKPSPYYVDVWRREYPSNAIGIRSVRAVVQALKEPRQRGRDYVVYLQLRRDRDSEYSANWPFEIAAATKGEAIKVAQDALTRHDAVITRTKGEAPWIRGRREAMQAPQAAPAPVTPRKAPDWLDGEDRPRRPLETRMVRNGGIPVRPANDLVTRYKIVKAQDGSQAIERTTTSDSTPDQNSRQRILHLYFDKNVAHWIVAYDDTGNTPMPGMASFKTRDVAQAWMKQLTHDLNAGSRDHSPREIDERANILVSFRRLPPAYQMPTPTTMRETNAERQRASVRERAEEAKRLADLIADPAKAQGIDVGDMVHAMYTANYVRYEIKGVITKRLTSSWKVRPIVQRKYRSGPGGPGHIYKPYQGAKDMTLPGKTDKGWTQNNGITGKTFITPAATVTR